MFKKIVFAFVFLTLFAHNTVFPQAAGIGTAVSNAENPQAGNTKNEGEKNAEAPENESILSENYTIGERLGIGALNIFGGAGSITRGERTGWLVPGIQGLGLLSVLGGAIFGITINPPPPPSPGADTITQDQYKAARERYELLKNVRRGIITAGCVVIGTGVVVGFVIPFFHQRPGNTNTSVYTAPNRFPFDLELVSSHGQAINGFRFSYNMRF